MRELCVIVFHGSKLLHNFGLFGKTELDPKFLNKLFAEKRNPAFVI